MTIVDNGFEKFFKERIEYLIKEIKDMEKCHGDSIYSNEKYLQSKINDYANVGDFAGKTFNQGFLSLDTFQAFIKVSREYDIQLRRFYPEWPIL